MRTAAGEGIDSVRLIYATYTNDVPVISFG